MSGIAILLDLLRKKPDVLSANLHSYSSFSAKVAVSAAVSASAAAAASYPFAFRAFLSNREIPVAYCDAAPAWSEDHIPSVHRSNIEPDSISYTPKEYYIQLKPLFSAFEWKMFTVMSLRSFLMYYLPLLEPKINLEEDDEDFLQDSPVEKQPVDLVTPFKKSVIQILRESTVVTTRRVLERMAVSYASQRLAWKLLKDAPKSAVRKAQKGLPTTVYFFSVSRMTFRAHCLGVAATWIVQVGIEIYRSLSCLFGSKEEELEDVDPVKELRLLSKKVFGATLKCSSSLVFASIGAGIGASLVRPSAGQWIGCALGDLAGPIIITVCLDKLLHYEL